MARDDLTYIDLADFGPGIRSGVLSSTAGEPHPDGSAKESGTYGCVSLPTGGIGPLPRWTFQQVGSGLITAESALNQIAAPDPEVHRSRVVILDARAASPLDYIPPFNQPADRTARPTDLFLVRQMWGRRKVGNNPEPWWYFSDHRDFVANSFTDGLANRGLSGIAQPPRNIIPSRWTYGGGSIAETRTAAQNGDKYRIGHPVVVAGMGGPRDIGVPGAAGAEGLDIYNYFTYPDWYDDANPNDQSVPLPAIPTYGIVFPASVIFGHQGRLMGLARTSGYKILLGATFFGNAYGYRSASESILYWPTNDVYDAGSPARFVAMEESASGYGTVCSVSADSLFLVKHSGGAVQINGDVENPTILRLPGIPSTGGITSRGVMTKAGFIYGTTNGVWLWTGSDTAEPASEALDPRFWIPDDPTVPLHERETIIGSFAYQHPFVFAPNNWMLDLRTMAWWRYAPTPAQKDAGITDPAATELTYAFNEIDGNGNLYALVKSYVQPSVFIRVFDPTAPATSRWRWESQPIARSQNRYLTYRRVAVVATGHGAINVTIRGIDGTTQTATVNVASNRSAMEWADLAITTTDIEVTIESVATDPAKPAPTVHRIAVGYRTNQTADRDGTIRGS